MTKFWTTKSLGILPEVEKQSNWVQEFAIYTSRMDGFTTGYHSKIGIYLSIVASTAVKQGLADSPSHQKERNASKWLLWDLSETTRLLLHGICTWLEAFTTSIIIQASSLNHWLLLLGSRVRDIEKAFHQIMLVQTERDLFRCLYLSTGESESRFHI